MSPSFAARFFMTLILCQTCTGVSKCPTRWLTYNNHCYFFGVYKTWWQARDDCVSKGAQLTSILDTFEQRWLTSALKKGSCWIGLSREQSGKPWQWDDGKCFSYSFWPRNEPNNVNNFENCVEIRAHSGAWNDHPCNISHDYICKRPLYPNTPTANVTCSTPAPSPNTTTAPSPNTTTANPVTCPTPAPCPTTVKPATCPTSPPAPTTTKPATCPPCTTTAKPATCPPCNTTATAKAATSPPCTTTAKPATCPPCNTTATAKAATSPPCTTTAKPATCPPCTTTAKPATCPPCNTTATAKAATSPPCTTTAKPATCPPCNTTATAKAATSPPCTTTAKVATCPTPAPCPTCPAGPPPTNGELEMCAIFTKEKACSSRNVTCSCLLAMLANPKGGFHAPLDGLSVARSIVIRGRANPQARRLVVNLDVRDASGKNVITALQLNMDLENQTFTLNSRVGHKWGHKQSRDLPQGRPFKAGLPFKIVIKCGSGTFHLDFNDELQVDFTGPRLDIKRINLLEVWQVMLSGVQLM